jgi:hypothetical protein
MDGAVLGCIQTQQSRKYRLWVSAKTKRLISDVQAQHSTRLVATTHLVVEGRATQQDRIFPFQVLPRVVGCDSADKLSGK